MKPLNECLLYAFVDTTYLRGKQAGAVAQELCDGGADLIQLRAKEASAEEVLRLARELVPVTRRAGVGLVINDYLAVAVEVGAEYCHLGQEDFFEAGYNRVADLPGMRRGMGIGLSSHEPAQAERALAAGADYLGVGPIYATGTKPGAVPVTTEYVRWAAAQVPVPWFAIGGITLGNLEAVLAAGARRICVVSAILNAPDAAEACRQFKARLLAAQARDQGAR
jgi:thiamine-phosphate pyrophosphorylase